MLRLFFFLTVIGTLFISGCKKCDCPEPPISGTFTVDLQPGSQGKDAQINSTAVNTNGGNDGRLFVMAATFSTVPGVIRSYLQFDYSSIPSTALINSAVLTLYADTTDIGISGFPNGHNQATGSNSWFINHVTSNWSESTITWNNQPTSNGVGQINLPASTNRRQTYTIDVTDFVKKEIANPNSYYGMVMQLDTEVEYRGVMFCSSDYPNSQQHPKLTLNYTLK